MQIYLYQLKNINNKQITTTSTTLKQKNKTEQNKRPCLTNTALKKQCS